MYIDISTIVNIVLTVVTLIMAIATCYMAYSTQESVKEMKNDPTSHAEIECIKKACKKINRKYLEDSEMYVTLEPCLMCVGAIKESRLKKIYVGAKDPKGGYVVSRETPLSKKELDKYSIGYMEDDISKLLKTFFKSKR